NWDEYLAAAEFAYNNSVQFSTGFTPFFLDNGQHPTTPTALMVTRTPQETNVAAADQLTVHWQNNLKIAKDALVDAQARQAEYANRQRRDDKFEVDDLVLLSSAHITPPQTRQRPTKKLSYKFLGPFRVCQVVTPVVYKLDLPASFKVHPVFHVSLLKRYVQ